MKLQPTLVLAAFCAWLTLLSAPKKAASMASRLSSLCRRADARWHGNTSSAFTAADESSVKGAAMQKMRLSLSLGRGPAEVRATSGGACSSVLWPHDATRPSSGGKAMSFSDMALDSCVKSPPMKLSVELAGKNLTMIADTLSRLPKSRACLTSRCATVSRFAVLRRPLRTKSTASWLAMTSHRPSHARIMNSSDATSSGSPSTSGMGEMAWAAAGTCAACFMNRSPSARLTACDPPTRPNHTCEPAAVMRSFSSGFVGLWSIDRGIALPSLHSTQRESPRFAQITNDSSVFTSVLMTVLPDDQP
mmetsp:Transcript_7466/g.18844  ORF Transcript_7466/g.18844 Transcript_7466/m.18844 type:complete len:305 (+) Transcript_7466:677-1591(+)